MNKIKSSDMRTFWVSHFNDKLRKEMEDKYAAKQITYEELCVAYNNQISWDEYIDYDHSRTLKEQVNEIIADKTVKEIHLHDNRPNPKHDGSNTAFYWLASSNNRELTDDDIQRDIAWNAELNGIENAEFVEEA